MAREGRYEYIFLESEFSIFFGRMNIKRRQIINKIRTHSILYMTKMQRRPYLAIIWEKFTLFNTQILAKVVLLL